MNEVTSSMAGTVLDITVNTGEQVTSAQEVLKLESMKMEIPIESGINGTVREIKVNIGDFVNEGDVLVLIED
ncbi:biotin/lipoyl-containing protein [Bacillus spongiae]|uniref:Biotin/lipoyl-containing protein n=1 Tax=Bacillus spongiae TaxID=2683610 RepID=A0ABU8H9S2_9BACI